jgi:hypothetical protein
MISLVTYYRILSYNVSKCSNAKPSQQDLNLLIVIGIYIFNVNLHFIIHTENRPFLLIKLIKMEEPFWLNLRTLRNLARVPMEWSPSYGIRNVNVG